MFKIFSKIAGRSIQIGSQAFKDKQDFVEGFGVAQRQCSCFSQLVAEMQRYFSIKNSHLADLMAAPLVFRAVVPVAFLEKIRLDS